MCLPDETEVLEETGAAESSGDPTPADASEVAEASDGAELPDSALAEVGFGENTVVIDLGRRRRRQVRRLRDGEGPLMDEVEDHVTQLRKEGVVGANAEVILVIASYRRRRKE